MLEQIQKVFRSIFQDEVLIIQATTSANDIKMWDSLIHIELIAAIEAEFNVEFSFNEVMVFNNVGDMIRSLETKLK